MPHDRPDRPGVINRDQRSGFVPQDSLQPTFGGGREGGIHLVDADDALELEDRIGEGGVEQGHPHGVAIELALQFRENQADGPRRAGAGGNQRLQA